MARKSGSQNTGYSVEERPRTTGKPHWRVRVWLLDSATGTTKPVIVGTYPTKKEAHEAGREAVHRRDRGTLLKPTEATVGDVLTDWLAVKASSISPNSHRDYEIACRLHLRPAFGTMKVQQLTPATVQRQYGRWQEAGMSGRMVRRTHVVLSQALDLAVRNGLAFRNAATGVTLPRLERTTLTVWSPAEARKFLEAAQSDGLHPLWHLLLFEGMRRGEALGLRWRDINWPRGTAHLVQTVIPDKSDRGKAVIQPRTKTASGARSVRLTEETVAALLEHRDRQRFIRQAAGEAWRDNDLIVCTGLGTPINPTNVSRSFAGLVRRTALPRIRVHDLRHTSATLLLLAGIPAKVVSERLGHASIGITLDLYSHVVGDMQTSAAEALSAMLKADTGS